MAGRSSDPEPAAWVLEMEDEVFRKDSAVFMPGGLDDDPPAVPPPAPTPAPPPPTGIEGLKVVFLFLREHPDRRILVTGHSDTVGEMRSNRDLSLKRARSVELHLLGGEDSRNRWARDVADSKHHLEDIQHILKWASQKRGWDTDPGAVDGRYGQKSQKALVAFHKRCNEEFGLDLPARGQVTVETWKGVFELYQDQLKSLLDVDEEGMATYRSKQLRWLDPMRHVDGCGESWPADPAPAGGGTPPAPPGPGPSPRRTNRRVEILFFDRNETPAFTNNPCPKETCPIYGGTARRVPLPPHAGTRPLTRPTFYAPDAPGSGTSVPIEGLWGYVVNFNVRGEATSVTAGPFRNGKLANAAGAPIDIEGDRNSWVYVSHRSDLASLARDRWFKSDRSGLPLLGPIGIPCGEDARVDIDIWRQNDWVVVQPHPTEGKADGAMLVEWGEDYWVGKTFDNEYDLDDHHPEGSPIVKELQEHWLAENGGGRRSERTAPGPPSAPLDRIPSANLVPFGPGPAYVGTLSALPIGGTAQHPPPRSNGRLPETPEAAREAKGKVLILFDVPAPTSGATPPGKHAVTSFNEIARTIANTLLSHHTYDGPKVDVLAALDERPSQATFDRWLKRYGAPPPRVLLPGDVSWQTQKQTEHCASFSMASAMNYWFPLQNNYWKDNGVKWVTRIRQLPLEQGATPGAVLSAAAGWNMNASFRCGERLDPDGAVKLVKLWLWAGVPLIVNIVESGPAGAGGALKNRHFKLMVGYDGDRLFFQNSGIDWERPRTLHQEMPVALRNAPLGNDVDMRAAFLAKWDAVSEGVAGHLITSAGFTLPARNFIPVYPKDPRFRGASAR